MKTSSDPRYAYRPDIDGLRAVAVAAVVLFHVDSAWLPGGFVGVDIFFVISGFLITSKIIESCQAGRFTFSDFYARRIRRILPVLFFVILSTLIAGQFILLPKDLERLGITAIAAQLSAANIYFTYFLDTSYFADDASLEPLLHLWSLGVEEQFYLFWPALLVLGLTGFKSLPWGQAQAEPVTSVSGRLIAIVAGFAVASSILGQLLVRTEPMFAYYMLPTRAGQLLAGALVFFALQRLPSASLGRLQHELLMALGLALIAGSLLLLSHRSTYPGFNALPVTMGASLVIFAGTQRLSLISRVLALSPMIAIGKISYSLYLWHWPILAFARYVYGDLTIPMQIGSIALMLALSVVSYWVIEKPFRRDKSSFLVLVAKQVVAPTMVVGIIAGLLIANSGLGLYLFNDGYRRALAGIVEPKAAAQFAEVCQESVLTPADFKKPSCKIGKQDSAQAYLWGDSQSAHYVAFLSELGQELNFTFRNASHSSCPPILRNPERFAPASRLIQCRESGVVVREHLRLFDKVILAAAWDNYLSAAFASELSYTIETLRKDGKKVFVIGQVPDLPSFDRKCGQKALKLSAVDCVVQARVERSVVDATNRRLRKIAQDSGALYYDANAYICDSKYCSSYLQGKQIYYNKSHLSHEGSRILGQAARRHKEDLRAFEMFFGN